MGGHSPPPPLFVNPNQPTFRAPTAPSSTGFQQEATQNPQNPVASAPSSRGFQQEATQNPENPIASNGGFHTLTQALSSVYQTIAGLTASGLSPPQSLWDSAASLARRLQDARLAPQQPLPSASAKPRSPQQGPNRPEATQRSPETARRVHQATTRVHEDTTGVHEATRRVQETTTRVPEPARGIPEANPRGHEANPRGHEATPRGHEATPRGHEATPRGHEATTRGRNTTQWSPEMTQRNPGYQEPNTRIPGRPDLGPTAPGPSKSRSFESPHRSSDRSSRRGSQTPPRKRRRHSGNSSDEDPAFQNRQHRDDQQEEEDNFRPSSLDLLLGYITSTFPTASQPFIQPSSKRFHIMETAGLVDESSQQIPNLAWYGCMRSAWDSAQRKFDAKVSEGKSLSSILTTVSRTERVSDSPCQGRATKVNSQVFDLMPSRPPESRFVPMSVREATSLETTLHGAMESYNFQLWIVTALFLFLGDSGCCPMDDPLLDQFQRSFSRGAENLAAALASSTALVSAKRRESFLTHMFPQSRMPRNASFFLIPCLTRRNFLRLPPLRLPVKRHEISPCTGGPNLAPPVVGPKAATTLQRTQLQGPSQYVSPFHITTRAELIIFFRPFPAEEEVLRSPQETRGFSEAGACPLAQHRRLPRPFLAGLDGSGGGCLGRGGLTRGVHDPILSETSLI